MVVCTYVGRVRETGEEFFRRERRTVRLGDGDVVPALELALRQLKCGERAKVRSEPRFAYGGLGRPAAAPGDRELAADTAVEFELELHALGSRDAVAAMRPQERAAEGQLKREIGNEHFRCRDYHKAARCYSVALKAVDGLLAESEEGEPAPGVDADAVLTLMVDCGNNMAACQLKLGDAKKAEEACIAVLQIDAANVKALYRAGIAARTQHKFDEAGLALEKALALEPGNRDVLRETRQLKLKIREYKEKDRKMAQAMGGKLFAASATPAAKETEKEKAAVVAPAVDAAAAASALHGDEADAKGSEGTPAAGSRADTGGQAPAAAAAAERRRRSWWWWAYAGAALVVVAAGAGAGVAGLRSCRHAPPPPRSQLGQSGGHLHLGPCAPALPAALSPPRDPAVSTGRRGVSHVGASPLFRFRLAVSLPPSPLASLRPGKGIAPPPCPAASSGSSFGDLAAGRGCGNPGRCRLRALSGRLRAPAIPKNPRALARR